MLFFNAMRKQKCYLFNAHRNELILVCFAVQHACNVILNALQCTQIVCAMHCNRTNVISSLHTIMHYSALHYNATANLMISLQYTN
jgi:hypothetical protein